MDTFPKRKQIRLAGYDYSQKGYYFVTICTHKRQPLFGEIVDATLRGHPNRPDKMIETWLLKTEEKFPDVKICEYVIMPEHIHFIVAKTDDSTETEHSIKPGECMEIEQNGRPHGGAPTDVTVTVGATLCGRPNPTWSPDGMPPEQQHGRPHRGAPTDVTVTVGATLCGRPNPTWSPDEWQNECPHRDVPTDVAQTCARTGASIPDIIGWFKTMTTNEYIRNVKNGKYMPFYKKIWQRGYYEHIIRNENEYWRTAEYIINNPMKWEYEKS